MEITIDILFSYWVFTWFLLFYFGLIKYNPFFIFVLIFIVCISWIFYAYITNKINNYNFFKSLTLTILFKLIPIIILIITKNYYIDSDDIIITIILIIIYLIYLKIKNIDVIDLYTNIFEKNLDKHIISLLYDYLNYK